MPVYILFAVLFISLDVAFAQRPLPIPPQISGENVNLLLSNSTKEFYSGVLTSTIGYNGSYLGPTIVLKKGQHVTLNVTNQLGDTTTTHWHGLHVAPRNDGGPHVMIMDKETWSPSFDVMDKAGTYWYHPHLHGKTLKQTVKGAAGLIIVQDDEEAALDLPRTYGVDDLPVILQFQTIDQVTKQIALNDEKDNSVFINGAVWPVATSLPAQVVRLRILNASSKRFFQLGFADNREFYQVTSDAGLLNSPVRMNRLMLGSGERAEILVDLSADNGKNVTVKQFGTEIPIGYPGGASRMGMAASPQGPLDNKDFDLLTIAVKPPAQGAVYTIPTTLSQDVQWPVAGALRRTIAITASPMMSSTNFLLNGKQFRMDEIEFTSKLDMVEIWTITNASMMPHPFHVHGNHFYVLEVNGQVPSENLRGRKDVITVPPMNGSVNFITKYEHFADPTLPYMFHCHMLSHEDNGMMGQFLVEEGSTWVSEHDTASESISVYPNPVKSGYGLNVRTQLNLGSVELVDVLGNTVYSGSEPSDWINIDTRSLSGVYFVRVYHDGRGFVKKLIVSQ